MPYRSRNNHEGLRKAFSAFEEYTSDLTKLEVILVMDDDDPGVEDVRKIAELAAFTVKVFVVQKSEWVSQAYINYGCKQATGDVIMLFNDDCYMVTPEWDLLIEKRAGERKVWFMSLYDSTYDDDPDERAGGFAKFPCVSRKAYEAVGFMLYPQIRSWGADNVCDKMYRLARCYLMCHEVRIQHDHVPTDRFNEGFEKDKQAGIFPIIMDHEVHRLKKAKEKYDQKTIEKEQRCT
jgi:hypothetical protein